MANEIKTEAIYCGSKRTGSSFSKRKVNLVYGGTDKGLMGVLAHSAFGKDTKVAEIIDKKFKS